MTRRFAALATLAVVLLAVPGMAQEAEPAGTQKELDELIEVVRKDVRAGKSELIAQNMSLDAAQAAKFWPVYEKLEKERQVLGDARLAIIKDYAANFENLTDEKAGELVKRSLDNEAARLELDRKYMHEFMQVLPPKVVARFYQVDNRINLLLDLEIAGQIPLVW